MMPIAAITGKSRGIKTQNRAHVAGAKPGYQPIEAWPCDSTTGRPPHIIVDNLDVDEAVLTSNRNEIVLAPLTFQIGHHLGLR
jgi:hypothetical protein